jgi:hypothetical protein
MVLCQRGGQFSRLLIGGLLERGEGGGLGDAAHGGDAGRRMRHAAPTGGTE